MRRLILMISVISFFSSLFSQETIIGLEETLSSVKVGEQPDQVAYLSSEDGFYSPMGPIVESDGSLLFFPIAGPNARQQLLKYSNGNWSDIPLFIFMRESGWGGDIYLFNSSAGYVISKSNDYVFSSDTHNVAVLFKRKMIAELSSSSDRRHYLLPIGEYFESLNPKWIYSVEKQKDCTIKVRNLEETSAWLTTQPGGFSIGDDGLLYHNGMVWSAIKPIDTTRGWIYVGKLISGHSLWSGGGMSFAPCEFLITDSRGITEIEIVVPWMVQAGEKASEEKKAYLYNYGLGPWGELYCLLPPNFIDVGGIKDGAGGFLPHYEPDPTGFAELVVVRNYLKYFGRLNDGGVRLRKDPSTKGEIIGTYPNKTGFRILETGTKTETIGGQTNVWYKVRLLDGTEGWFFGAFVHNLYDGPNGNPPPWPNVPDW